MPTYEYRCKDCGHEIEIVQSFTDEPLTECPECQGSLRKVFGNVGITFKGSGFYKTDSRSGSGGTNGAKTKAGSESGGSSKESSKESGGPSKETASSSSASSSSSSSTSTASSGSD